MCVQGHFTITLMYFELFRYINKVYRTILKGGNLPMKHIQTTKKIGRGVTNSVQGVYGYYQRCQPYFSVNTGHSQHSSLFFVFWKMLPYKETMSLLNNCVLSEDLKLLISPCTRYYVAVHSTAWGHSLQMLCHPSFCFTLAFLVGSLFSTSAGQRWRVWLLSLHMGIVVLSLGYI